MLKALIDYKATQKANSGGPLEATCEPLIGFITTPWIVAQCEAVGREIIEDACSATDDAVESLGGGAPGALLELQVRLEKILKKGTFYYLL